MIQITIQLDEEQARRLAVAAEQRETTVEELVRLGALALVESQEQQFEGALETVLQKNRELYRRLA
jgi:hypothetical protein